MRKPKVDLERFRGNGAVNELGETLDEFIEQYNPGDYDNPSVTTDVLIFAYEKEYKGLDNLKLLLIRRKNHPCIGHWALPGGFVEYDEDMNHAAARELYEETGLNEIPLKQMHTWGNADRDPRTRIVTTTYMAFVERSKVRVKAGDDAADAQWFQVQVEEIRAMIDSPTGMERVFRITLSAEEDAAEEIQFSVKVHVEDYKIIQIKTYTILENHGLAFDHPKAVMQALDEAIIHV
ncbi:MAG: NUDIX domain-containing protein [Lachnospiraceae bacterium]